MTPNEKRAAKLRSHLQKWLRSHQLFESSSFDTPEQPEEIDTSQGAEPVYLTLSIDGSLFDMFYKREFDGLHTEFDQIVADHGFWYEFEDSTNLSFMHDAQRDVPPA